MARRGTYSLSERRDTSFRNFIFVLLTVLTLLVLIYLVMAFGISPSKGDDKDSKASELSGEGKFGDSTTITTTENEGTMQRYTSHPMHTDQTSTITSSTKKLENDFNKTIRTTDSGPTTISRSTEIIYTNLNTISTSRIEKSTETIGTNSTTGGTTKNERIIPPEEDSNTTFRSTETYLTGTISTKKEFSPTDSGMTTISSSTETTTSSNTDTIDTNLTTISPTKNAKSTETIGSNSTTDSTTEKESITLPKENSYATFRSTEKPATDPTIKSGNKIILSPTDSGLTTISSTTENTTSSKTDTTVSTTKNEKVTETIGSNSTTDITTEKESITLPKEDSYATFRSTEKPATDPTIKSGNKKILSPTDSGLTTISSTTEKTTSSNTDTIDTNLTTISTTKNAKITETIGSNSTTDSTTEEESITLPKEDSCATFRSTEKPATDPTIKSGNKKILSPTDSGLTTISSTTENTTSSNTEIIDTNLTTISSTKNAKITETVGSNLTTDSTTEKESITLPKEDSYATFRSTKKPEAGSTNTNKSSSSTDSGLTTIPSTTETTTFGTTEKMYTNLTTIISTTKIAQTTETIGTNLTTNNPTEKSSSTHNHQSTTYSNNGSIIFVSASTEAISPKICEDIACKKASSQLLAMMNHDEDLDYCEDFYNYACGDSSIIESVDDAYFRITFKAIAKTKGYSKKSKYSQIFNIFYDDCNRYRDDFIIKDTLNNLNSIEQHSLKDIFVHMLLTQSMPFFDVGLGVRDNHSFEYEITLPEFSSLRTSLPEWSLMEQMKKQCIRDITDQLKDNHNINLDESMNATHDCIKNYTKRYIISFVEEMEELQELLDNKSLVDSFRNHSDGLHNLMDSLQDHLLINIDSLKNEKASLELTTLEELNTLYTYVDWIKVFNGITRNISITDGKTPVKMYFSNHIKEVLRAIGNETELRGILNLWYNIQMFRSAGFGKSYGKETTHCLKLASQLMPEISVSLVNDISLMKSPVQYKLVETLFQQLKSRFANSFSKTNMTSDSVTIFQNRLNEIQLRSNLTNSKIFSVGTYENDLDMANKSYHEKLMVLLKNYRKTVFSLAGRRFSDVEDLADYLLLYFVDPFETEPKTFPPSRHIVFHPGFLYGVSQKLPSYVELATKGFRLGQQIAKHFVKDDFSPELEAEEKEIYTQLRERSEKAEFDLIGGKIYKFDNDEYDINQSYCQGNCLNGAEMFEDNAAFRLVTDSLEDLKDKNLNILPYLDDTISTEKYFVTFIAQELCQRQTIVDFLADLYGGRKIPPPVKMRSMVSNSIFFKTLYGCEQPKNPEEIINQFPFIITSAGYGPMGNN